MAVLSGENIPLIQKHAFLNSASIVWLETMLPIASWGLIHVDDLIQSSYGAAELADVGN